VTATPTTGLHDGSTVSVHAEVGGGALIYNIAAHVCVPDVEVTNTFNFGFQGPLCARLPIGSGQQEVTVAVPGSTTADLSIKVGTGTVVWPDELDNVHTITCDADHACNLVIELEVTGTPVFKNIALTFGGSAPPASSAPANPAASGATSGNSGNTASAGATSGGSAASGSATNASSSHAASAQGTGANATSTGGTHSAASGGSSSSSSSSSNPGTKSKEVALGTESVNTDSSIARRAARVFSAGAAGLIGGLLIALIVLRARRQMLA
jgi:hypothetical protein